MSKLKGILLTEGMHGMISQVEGLAKALDIDFTHHKVELNNFWKLIPPIFTPVSQIVYKKLDHSGFDLIISCGRKSIIPSIHLKNTSNKKVFNIHIQDPKVNLDNFDTIICPEHDNLHGDNVLKTKGAIHYLTNNEIQKNINYLQPKKGDKKIITFILGGPNKYYSFSEKQLDRLFAKVKNMFVSSKYKLIVIPSYRTPENILKLAYNYFNEEHLVIKERDKKAYLSSLGLASIIIVTCDSTSMISEAAITGKPVYVAQMNNKLSIHRFEKFYKLFKDLGIIRDLNDKIEHWTYSGLDEVNRAASMVKEKMKTNGII